MLSTRELFLRRVRAHLDGNFAKCAEYDSAGLDLPHREEYRKLLEEHKEWSSVELVALLKAEEK